MVISVLHVRNPRCNQYPTNHHAAFAAPFPIYARAESGARSPQRDHLLALGLGADCDDSYVDRSSCACIIQCCTVCCVHCSTTQCPVHPACRCLHTHTRIYIIYIQLSTDSRSWRLRWCVRAWHPSPADTLGGAATRRRQLTQFRPGRRRDKPDSALLSRGPLTHVLVPVRYARLLLSCFCYCFALIIIIYLFCWSDSIGSVLD